MTTSANEIGAYPPAEAAHYLHVPLSTLRAWLFGQKGFKPVIEIADPKDRLLSFHNLVEVHVLNAIRRAHQIPLPKIRQGLKYVEQELGTKRPLLNQNFTTDGLDLFVEHSGLIVNVSQAGQTVLRETLDRYLKRIERDTKGIPIRLYPFSRHSGQEDIKSIVIDPKVQFGRPVLVGTGVATANIFSRFLAGEPIEELSQDFKVDKSLIEEAIRCEQVAASVA